MSLDAICLLRRAVVGVGEVDAGGRDVVERLPLALSPPGDVDDVQDLGTAEAGLHGTHAGEARAGQIRRLDSPPGTLCTAT
jgi:hypothetical protein